MEYRCPKDDRLFTTITDHNPPGKVIKGKFEGDPDKFAPGHEHGGHPDCDGVYCTAQRAAATPPPTTPPAGTA